MRYNYAITSIVIFTQIETATKYLVRFGEKCLINIIKAFTSLPNELEILQLA